VTRQEARNGLMCALALEEAALRLARRTILPPPALDCLRSIKHHVSRATASSRDHASASAGLFHLVGLVMAFKSGDVRVTRDRTPHAVVHLE
jgi:DNA-binding GntR family transcriptional regulator